MEQNSQELEEEVRLRIRELIDEEAPAHRKFKHMEEAVGGTAMTWRNIYNGTQKASMVYMALLGRAYEKYAYWLVTGQTDEEHGHTSPVLERIQRDLRTAGRGAG